MRSPMDERTYLDFYKNTVLGSSKGVLNSICQLLERKNKITFEAQRNILDDANVLYFESKRDHKKVVSDTTTNIKFASFMNIGNL